MTYKVIDENTHPWNTETGYAVLASIKKATSQSAAKALADSYNAAWQSIPRY